MPFFNKNIKDNNMIKPEIQQKIIAAANKLTEEGIKDPTNDQVREKLGGGSLSHISPVMREWRNSRKEAVEVAIDMPTELKNTIELALVQVWNAAAKLAFADLEETKRESLDAIGSISLERDEAFNEIQKLESRIEILESENLIQKESCDTLRAEKDQLAKKLLTSEEKVKSQAELLTDRKNQITELNKNFGALQKELLDIAKKNK